MRPGSSGNFRHENQGARPDGFGCNNVSPCSLSIEKDLQSGRISRIEGWATSEKRALHDCMVLSADCERGRASVRESGSQLRWLVNAEVNGSVYETDDDELG